MRCSVHACCLPAPELLSAYWTCGGQSRTSSVAPPLLLLHVIILCDHVIIAMHPGRHVADARRGGAGEPGAGGAEPAAVRRPGSASTATAHAAAEAADAAATTPLGGKPASLGAVKPDTPAKGLECKPSVPAGAPEASTDSGAAAAAPGSSEDLSPNPAGNSGGSGTTEGASEGGERADPMEVPGEGPVEEGEPVRERRTTSRKKARAAVAAAAAAAAAGEDGGEEDERVAVALPAVKTKRASGASPSTTTPDASILLCSECMDSASAGAWHVL